MAGEIGWGWLEDWEVLRRKNHVLKTWEPDPLTATLLDTAEAAAVAPAARAAQQPGSMLRAPPRIASAAKSVRCLPPPLPWAACRGGRGRR